MVNVYAFYINRESRDYVAFLHFQMYSNETLFLVVSGLKTVIFNLDWWGGYNCSPSIIVHRGIIWHQTFNSLLAYPIAKSAYDIKFNKLNLYFAI